MFQEYSSKDMKKKKVFEVMLATERGFTGTKFTSRLLQHLSDSYPIDKTAGETRPRVLHFAMICQLT